MNFVFFVEHIWHQVLKLAKNLAGVNCLKVHTSKQTDSQLGHSLSDFFFF